MVSDNTRTELEATLGTVPSFIAELADPAADHSWGIMRDLELSDTELPGREKALVGLGAAAAIQCPYCIHFHKAEAEMEGVSEEGMKEAMNVASAVNYFSTVLHGAEIEMDEFAEETAGIVAHIEEQQSVAGDD